jgi:hypothetical protein
MTDVFKQTGPTQQITTTGAGAWGATAKTFGILCGAVRVYNSGPNEAQVVLADTPDIANAPAALTDTAISPAMTLPPGAERIFGPFQGQVWFNAAGVAGNMVQFTPGSTSR